MVILLSEPSRNKEGDYQNFLVSDKIKKSEMVSSGNNRVARFIHGQCDIFFFLNCKNKAVVVSHGTGWDKTKASVHCKMTNIQIG